MKAYIELLKDIVANGVQLPCRNGDRKRVFGRQIRFDLSEHRIPLVDTHQIFVNGMIRETLWFLSGDTNANNLSDNGVRIWDKWKLTPERIEEIVEDMMQLSYGDRSLSESQIENVREQMAENIKNQFDTLNAWGTIGPMYGLQWRWTPSRNQVFIHPKVDMDLVFQDRMAVYRLEYDQMLADCEANQQAVPFSFEDYVGQQYYQTFDQLNDLVRQLKKDPASSRMVVSAWDAGSLPFPGIKPVSNIPLGRGALPPCHVLFQAFVNPPAQPGGKPRLSLQMYQRSCDVPVGFPFNIAQYSLLTHMLAHVVDMEAHEFIWVGGDVHIYENQMDLVKQEIAHYEAQVAADATVSEPRVYLSDDVTDLTAFSFEDIIVENYQPSSKIKYPVSE